MTNYIKEHLFSFLASIPILLISIGTIIINNYLSKYGLVDFTLIQGNVLFVGFVFITIIICYFVFWLLFMDISNIYCISIFKHITNSIIKPVLITTLFSALFFANEKLADLKIFNIIISGAEIKKYADSFIVLPIGFIFLRYIFLKDDKKLEKDYMISGVLNIIVISICILLSAIAIYLSSDRKEILSFFLTCSFFLLSFIVGVHIAKQKIDDGISIKPTSLFDSKREQNVLDKAFRLLMCLLAIITLISKYSKNIYPLLPYNAGGNKSKDIVIIENNGMTENGRIIHQNIDSIYIENDQEGILKINWEDIKSIKK